MPCSKVAVTSTLCSIFSLHLVSRVLIVEAGELGNPVPLNGAGGAVGVVFAAALGLGAVGLGPFSAAVVVGLAVNEGDHGGVLLDGTRRAQVAQKGALVVAAALAGAGELGEGHDRHVQLLGQSFQAAGDGRDLLGAVLVIPFAGGRGRGRH